MKNVNFQSLQDKSILFSPLNWGWGHCSRSIALLKVLLDQGNEIWVATNEEFKTVYSTYFDDLNFLYLEDYKFNFGDKGNFLLDLTMNGKSLYQTFKKERALVEKWVQAFEIDVVVSDHRLGFRSGIVPSVVVCHQLNLKHHFFAGFINLFHRSYLNRFDAVWVPDDERASLSGELSLAEMITPIEYIGILSRFRGLKSRQLPGNHLLIVSGPEPHAWNLYRDITDEYIRNQVNIQVIYSRLTKSDRVESQFVDHIENTNWKDLDAKVLEAELIISRSGYSTIMDLNCIDADYRLIPTPGQGEQLYLAERHKKSPQ